MRLPEWLRRWWRDLNDDPDYDPKPEDTSIPGFTIGRLTEADYRAASKWRETHGDIGCPDCRNLSDQLHASEVEVRKLRGEVTELRAQLEAASGLLVSHGRVESVELTGPPPGIDWQTDWEKRAKAQREAARAGKRLGYVKASEAAAWDGLAPETVARRNANRVSLEDTARLLLNRTRLTGEETASERWHAVRETAIWMAGCEDADREYRYQAARWLNLTPPEQGRVLVNVQYGGPD